MPLTPDLRSTLIDLLLSLEELLTRPLREQEYKPDLSRIVHVAQLTMGQVRHALALDEETQDSLDHTPPMWCPPELLGARIRARQESRAAASSYSRRKPRP